MMKVLLILALFAVSAYASLADCPEVRKVSFGLAGCIRANNRSTEMTCLEVSDVVKYTGQRTFPAGGITAKVATCNNIERKKCVEEKVTGLFEFRSERQKVCFSLAPCGVVGSKCIRFFNLTIPANRFNNGQVCPEVIATIIVPNNNQSIAGVVGNCTTFVPVKIPPPPPVTTGAITTSFFHLQTCTTPTDLSVTGSTASAFTFGWTPYPPGTTGLEVVLDVRVYNSEQLANEQESFPCYSRLVMNPAVGSITLQNSNIISNCGGAGPKVTKLVRSCQGGPGESNHVPITVPA